MENIILKKLTSQDVSALKDIAKKTFVDTFGPHNTPENMEIYVSKSFQEEYLLEQINIPNSQFYFATEEDKILGYLKVNIKNAQTEIQDQNSLEIERIYVLKEFHGKKVGQILLNKALEIANELKVDFAWLGVWEQNKRAVNFYQKNGFEIFGEHQFHFGDEEQTDLMMKLNLR